MGSGELAPKLLPASTGHRQRSAKFSYDQMALHARTASATFSSAKPLCGTRDMVRCSSKFLAVFHFLTLVLGPGLARVVRLHSRPLTLS